MSYRSSYFVPAFAILLSSFGLAAVACGGNGDANGTGGTGGTGSLEYGSALGTGGGADDRSLQSVSTELVACDSQCVDVDTDRTNCGDCGIECELGAECENGECTGCPAGQDSCDGVCVDVTNNNAHCGVCDNDCGSGYCVDGSCIENTCEVDPYNPIPQGPCGESGACIPLNDSPNCGACGIECAEGAYCALDSNAAEGNQDFRCRCGNEDQVVCDGACRNVLSENEHCGGCGIECVGDQWCDQGSCTCGANRVLCNGKCENIDQCASVSGGVASLKSFDLPSYDLMAGDGSIECGVVSTDPGTGTGTVGTNPDAGDHCGGGEWTTGKATWYSLATPLVHCSYPTSTLPSYYGAMNDAQYGVADVCGACVEVKYPEADKQVTIQIVDECPYEGNEKWCYAGSNHIDLSPDAFQALEDPVKGVLDIEWRYVPCEPTSDLEVTFKDGSNIYWTAVMIRNHPVPITSVELLKGTEYQALTHMEYNYWLLESGFGPGPYTLRITDSSGAVVETSELPTIDGKLAESRTNDAGVQLSSCN